MIMPWSPDARLLGWDERLDLRPLGVGHFATTGCGDNRRRHGVLGSFTQMASAVAALCLGLMGAPPARPPKLEGPLLIGRSQGLHQPAHLRHRQWQQRNRRVILFFFRQPAERRAPVQ